MAEKRIYVDLDAKENVSIGTGTAAATYPARLNIKGSSIANTSSSLLVENVAGLDMFHIRDDGSWCLGYNNVPNNRSNVIIGFNIAALSGANSVLIGSAVSDGGGSGAHVIIGSGASTSGATAGVVIGANAVGVQGSVSIGQVATAASAGVAIGFLSDAVNGVAIGNGAQATISTTTAVGSSCIASHTQSNAYGDSAEATANGATAIGFNSTVTGQYGVVLGWQSNSAGVRSIGIGREVLATGADSVVIGYEAEVLAVTYGTAIGAGTAVTGSGGIMMGYRLTPNLTKITNSVADSFALGWNTATPTVLLASTADQYIAGVGGLAIGSGFKVPLAKLHLKGIGATSGTTSFLVENSAGVDALVVKDNLNVYANGSGGILSNTAFGSNASITNLTGARNTAFGESALRVNTRSENTAFGWETLKANTTGSRNTAVGRSSMSLNSLGSSNTAVGYTALQNNVIGSDNTLVGKGAMGSNVDGDNNTGVGVDVMHDALTGDGNTVIGYNGMYSIIDGSNNTSVGDTAARENISGTRNISLGYNSGRYNLVSNTLYIHNGLGVTTTIDEKTNSIIYGVMDAVANNQRLTFNSSVGIGVVASTTAKLHVAGNATDGTAALRVEDSAGLSSITIQNNGVVVLREFTVATLPTQVSGGIIIVTDETGGHTMATSDGTNWRRVSDGQIVS